MCPHLPREDEVKYRPFVPRGHQVQMPSPERVCHLPCARRAKCRVAGLRTHRFRGRWGLCGAQVKLMSQRLSLSSLPCISGTQVGDGSIQRLLARLPLSTPLCGPEWMPGSYLVKLEIAQSSSIC